MSVKLTALSGALALALLAGTTAATAAAEPFGWSEGATVIKVDAKTPRIDTISGIIYSQIKTDRAMRQLRMTVMTPRTKALKPAVVYFPGGGFTTADYEKFTEMRTALARAGFVVAAAEYRVVPDRYPALVEDGKAAVRYLRAHAKAYGIDPKRIAVLGDSAGGYLSQMLGATNGEKAFDKGDWLDYSSDVQAVVTLYGISDLTDIGEGFSKRIRDIHAAPNVTEALLLNGPAFAEHAGASVLADRKKTIAASPIGHIDGNEPPYFILHGAADTLVSPLQSKKLYEALKAKGEKADYLIVENAGHGDLNWFQKPVIDRVVKWLSAQLKPEAGVPAEGNNL